MIRRAVLRLDAAGRLFVLVGVGIMISVCCKYVSWEMEQMRLRLKEEGVLVQGSPQNLLK